MKRKTKLALAMMLASLPVMPLGVYAEEIAAPPQETAPQEYELSEIVVTAQRVEKTEFETPATMTVITAQEIEEAGYRNAFEAIDQQIGSTSTSYGETGQDFGFSSGRITLRGYDRGTLVLVDGVPMNLKNYPSVENIPTSMIERIEVVKGASSTLYGAEAMGGVINIILKKPQAGMNEGKIYGTYGNYFKKFGASYTGEQVMVDISREYSRNLPHSNQFGYDKLSTTDWWVGKGKKKRAAIAVKLNEEISFNYNYMDGDITRGGHAYDRDTKTHTLKPASKNPNYYYHHFDKRHTANLTYKGKTNGIKAMLGYNYRKVEGSTYFEENGSSIPGGKPISSNRRLDSEIFDIQKQWKFNKDSLIVGYSYKRDATEKITKSATGINDFSRHANSLYLSYDKAFGDKFNMTIGMRGERISTPGVRNNVFLPQIQTDYRFTEDVAWYVNIGKAYQVPEIDTVMNNSDKNLGSLKPEQGWTYETGVKIRDGRNTWKVAVYHMSMKDKLGWSGAKNLGPDGKQYAVNKGDFRNTGIEVEYLRRIDKNWSIKLGASLSNPQIKDPSVAKPVWTQDAGRVQALASLNYHKDKFTSVLDFKYLGDREYYSTASMDVPSKLVLNWNFSYKFDNHHNVSFGVYNLLDKELVSNKYGNMDLRRNFRVNYEFTF